MVFFSFSHSLINSFTNCEPFIGMNNSVNSVVNSSNSMEVSDYLKNHYVIPPTTLESLRKRYGTISFSFTHSLTYSLTHLLTHSLKVHGKVFGENGVTLKQEIFINSNYLTHSKQMVFQVRYSKRQFISSLTHSCTHSGLTLKERAQLAAEARVALKKYARGSY